MILTVIAAAPVDGGGAVGRAVVVVAVVVVAVVVAVVGVGVGVGSAESIRKAARAAVDKRRASAREDRMQRELIVLEVEMGAVVHGAQV